RYSPDGKWIAYWIGERQANATIGVVQSGGGQPRQLDLNPTFSAARYPLWSPDGKYLLFLGRPSAAGYDDDWWVASVETGKVVRRGAFDVFRRQGLPVSYASAAADWVGGKIIFSARLIERSVDRGAQQHDVGVIYDSSNLWQVPIETGTWRISAPASRLTF